jgi:hypothetical protein
VETDLGKSNSEFWAYDDNIWDIMRDIIMVIFSQGENTYIYIYAHNVGIGDFLWDMIYIYIDQYHVWMCLETGCTPQENKMLCSGGK